MSQNQDELLPSRRLGVYLRRNKLGKIDFGQMPEWVRRAQIRNDRVITQLKLLDGQGGMTGAVAAGIATIVIIVLFERGTRTLVRG